MRRDDSIEPWQPCCPPIIREFHGAVQDGDFFFFFFIVRYKNLGSGWRAHSANYKLKLEFVTCLQIGSELRHIYIKFTSRLNMKQVYSMLMSRSKLKYVAK